ncbi:hypothetical protein J437_LFUL008427, partial [Ladona fulva]
MEDVSLICVNSTGAFLQLMYVLIYLLYSQRKVIIVRQLSALTLMLSCAILYAYHEPDPNLAKYRIGLLCCSFTLLFFFAPFTVLAQVVRTKNADILPFPLIIMTFIVSLQWFVYGVLLHDTFIQIPNAIGCILSSIQLSLFVVYPNSSKTEKWGAKEALKGNISLLLFAFNLVTMPFQEYKDIVGTLAAVTTIAQFLSPIVICLDITKKGSTKDVSIVPFLGGIVVGILNLKYGLLLQDATMIQVNVFAILLNIVYLFIYYRYSDT